jgi:hypothetical protein
MGTFVRAVVTGFGFSLGKLIFDKVKERYIDPLDPSAAQRSGNGNGNGYVDVTAEE